MRCHLTRALPLLLFALAQLACRDASPSEAAESPTPSAGLGSYRRAREVLDRGIAAMGGEAALRDVRTVRRRFAGRWAGNGQWLRPLPAGARPGDVVFHERDEAESLLDYAAQRGYERLRFAPVEDEGEHAVEVEAFTPDGAFQLQRYGEERPFLRRFGADAAAARRTLEQRRHPEALLLAALARPETLAWIAPPAAGKHEVVSFADADGSHVLLYFDADTHLLAKTESLRDHVLAGDTTAALAFSDYRPVGRLSLPFRYVDHVAGLPTQDWRVRELELNVAVPDHLFQLPADAVPVEPEPAEPAMEAIGRDLYLLRGEYNVVFAVLPDEVIVVEAPVGARFAEWCLEQVRRVAPGKAIRLVVTHFHYDHVAGVRSYVAGGVPILTTGDAKGVIERAAGAAPRTLRPDRLSRAPRAPAIATVRGRSSLGAGRVEVFDVGPTAHVAQMLVAYFPEERLLYQADLWDVPARGFAVAGADGALLAQRIRELGLRVERIVPAHGVPSDPAALAAALEIRARYVR
jgi:glyoxylase-like metal-dependent hydrolase (beta-lactamase superfamily II)